MTSTDDPEAVDPAEFEDLPTTDIDVEIHVHFGMTGAFPLRIADLFFATDGLHIVEYGYITLMFGLGAKKHRREAAGMRRIFDVHGIDEVLLQGDSVTWLNYGVLERVVVHDGGWLGRPRIGVYTADDRSYAYRLHGEVPLADLLDELRAAGGRHGFEVERRSGVGFSPRESLRRFSR